MKGVVIQGHVDVCSSEFDEIWLNFPIPLEAQESIETILPLTPAEKTIVRFAGCEGVKTWALERAMRREFQGIYERGSTL